MGAERMHFWWKRIDCIDNCPMMQARDRAWAKMSPPGRRQFFQLAPGHARTQEDLTEDSEVSRCRGVREART